MERSSGDGILDIPHPAILRYRNPSDLIEDFKNTWGQPPTGVILPIVASDGLLFDIPGSGLQMSAYRYIEHNSKTDIFDVALEFSELGQDIYLLLEPSLHFVRTSALHISGISGIGSPQVCIGNPRAQQLMGLILGTAMDNLKEKMTLRKNWKLAGIIIDAVGLLPINLGDNGRLELTCFCDSCRKFFNKEQPELLRHFDTFPNPWHLVLKRSDDRNFSKKEQPDLLSNLNIFPNYYHLSSKITATNISYIQNLPMDISDTAIVGLSRQKAFDLIFEKELNTKDDAILAAYARHLKTYMQVRHQQITASIDAIFQEALNGFSQDSNTTPKRIILTEGDFYSWTAGMQLDRLYQEPASGKIAACDEVWFDSTSPEMFSEHMEFRSYMWERARYFIDSFFQAYANASDPVMRSTIKFAQLSKDEVKELLQQRLKQVMARGGEKGKVALAALPELDVWENKLTHSKRRGFVGVAFTQEIGTELINKLQIVEGLNDKGVTGNSQ